MIEYSNIVVFVSALIFTMISWSCTKCTRTFRLESYLFEAESISWLLYSKSKKFCSLFHAPKKPDHLLEVPCLSYTNTRVVDWEKESGSQFSKNMY